MTDKEINWLSGLLEGEGCFTLTRRKYKNSEYQYPTVKLKMTDEDVVFRAAKLMNGKPVRLVYRHKPTFEFSISGRRAEVFMASIRPLMGVRRRARISEVLAVRKSYRRIRSRRAVRALRLRKSGKTFTQIAMAIGVRSHTSAMRIVKSEAAKVDTLL